MTGGGYLPSRGKYPILAADTEVDSFFIRYHKNEMI